jgi:hypothetical protein
MTINTKVHLWDNNQSTRYNIFNLLCLTLIASIFFTNLIHLRYLGNKLQLTEIFFLLTLPFVPYKKIWSYQLNTNNTFIKLVLLYLMFDLTSSILSHQAGSLFESLGRFYLFAFFLILNYHFSTFKTDELLSQIFYLFIFCTICLAIMAIYGYIMISLNKWTPYYLFFLNYPYFGSIYRLRGPTIHPSMLISLVTFPLIYFMGIFKGSRIKQIVTIGFILLFICAFLTFSKSLLLIAFAAVVFLLKRLGVISKATLFITTLIFTLAMIFITHVIVINKNSTEAKNFQSTNFTSDRVLFENDHYKALEASYLTLKKVELKMAAEHPLFGVGTGNFNKQLHVYKKLGLFPQKLPDFDPHSTYLGALAENGLFAAAMLLIVFIYVFIKFIKTPNLFQDNFLLALFLIYLSFLIDGIATDILNFRHLWLFFALALTYLQQSKPAIDRK